MTVEDALLLYNIPYIITEKKTGAGFTDYKLTPAGSSATVQRIKTRINDLCIATGQHLDIINNGGALYIRRTDKQPVYNYFDYNGYIDYNDANIPFIVGFNQNGIIIDSIDAARHILIAGTTGSGKSVFLHNLIYTICCNSNNYLYLVDCKQVEFFLYEKAARVASDVFGDNSAGSYTALLCESMDDRYIKMKRAGVNNFMDYKNIYPEARRHILIIDELSDLIGDKEARRVIIPRLLRLAQKGRAAGFHIVLATQRPDATVINGTLKGNMPTRLAFRTISNIDSRIIFDQSGAEKLNGNGDALYLRNGAQCLERLQAPFISIEDIKRTA